MKDETMTMPERDGSAGFTMIELLVGMVIMGALAVFSTSGWMSYQRTVEHRGSAQELVSALRNAQQRALSEASSYCMQLTPANGSYELFKGSCGAAGTGVQTGKTQSDRVDLVAPSFLQSDGTLAARVTFTARGSASKGAVTVSRQNADRQYIVSVEGLTGRVQVSG